MWCVCVCVCVYTMKYYGMVKKNEMLLFIVTWIQLEIIILSEVCKKEKDKYPIISPTFGIKYDTNEPICETETESGT